MLPSNVVEFDDLPRLPMLTQISAIFVFIQPKSVQLVKGSALSMEEFKTHIAHAVWKQVVN